MRAQYYADDFLFFDGSSRPLLNYFAARGAAHHAYRPLEAIILGAIQQRYLLDTLPIHVLSFTFHGLLCCLVLLAARRLRLRPAQAIVATALMVVTQVAAPALVGNDTLSQVASSLFGTFGVFLFASAFGAFSDREKMSWTALLYSASILSCTLALLFKETAVGFFAAIAVLSLVLALQSHSWHQGIGRMLVLLAPFVGVGIGYLILRSYAGAPLASTGTYAIHVGLNVPANLATFAFIALSPVSSVISGLAVQSRNFGVLTISATLALGVLSCAAFGTRASNRLPLVLLLCACAVAALFPMFLMTHVSELYLYNAMPFLTLALGISLGALWDLRGPARLLAGCLISLLILGQAAANHDKASRMAANGRRATELIGSIAIHFAELPPESRVFLINPAQRKRAFSVYVTDGFDVVEYGARRMGELHNRPDIKVSVIEELDARSLRPDSHTLLLAPDGETRVKRHESPAR